MQLPISECVRGEHIPMTMINFFFWCGEFSFPGEDCRRASWCASIWVEADCRCAWIAIDRFFMTFQILYLFTYSYKIC